MNESKVAWTFLDLLVVGNASQISQTVLQTPLESLEEDLQEKLLDWSCKPGTIFFEVFSLKAWQFHDSTCVR